MKHLRKTLTIVAAAVAVTSGGTMALIACSSDGSVTTAGDGGTDSPVTPPNNPPNPPPGDAGKDVIVVEAGTLAEFVAQNAQATCQRYKECCTAGTDAGFDLTSCENDFKGDGWDQSLHDISKPGVENGGKLVFDPAAGTDCLTAVRNMTCVNTPAAEFKNAWEKCFAAVHGTVAVGQPCKATVECAATDYCETDGGTCQALKAVNAPCSETDPSGAECSYRSVGANQCFDDGVGGKKCQPALTNGKDCNFDWDCNSGACAPVDGGAAFQCASTVDFLSGICDLYKPDGG